MLCSRLLLNSAPPHILGRLGRANLSKLICSALGFYVYLHYVLDMEIVFATGNRHKVEEASQILGPDFILKTPADLGIVEEIPETSPTIEGNALQKATYIWKKTGKPCFADDTGLFVDALGGEPGVKSARYAGEGRDAGDNMRKLLKALSAVPRFSPEGKKLRTARFRCVIAYVSDAGHMLFEGSVEGEIALEKSGSSGFGYDPVFLPEECTPPGRSFAELSAEEKNAVSHRGRALRKFAEYMRQ